MRKGTVISIIALLVSIVGLLVALIAYFKRRSCALCDDLDDDLLEYYGEALEDHMGDLIPKLDYTTLFTRNGLVGVGDGAAWFGLVEDGEIRLFSLWSGQGLGVGPIVSEPTRG